METPNNQPAQAPQTNQAAAAPAKKKNGCLIALIIVGVLCVILVIGGVVAFNIFIKPNIPTISGKDGNEQITIGGVSFGAGVPKDFPKDIAVYPSAKVESSISGENEGKKGSWLYLSSDDAPAKVAEFYTQKMTGEGWSVENTTDAGAVKTMAFKKEGRAAMVLITDESGKSKIAIFTGNQ